MHLKCDSFCRTTRIFVSGSKSQGAGCSTWMDIYFRSAWRTEDLVGIMGVTAHEPRNSISKNDQTACLIVKMPYRGTGISGDDGVLADFTQP